MFCFVETEHNASQINNKKEFFLFRIDVMK